MEAIKNIVEDIREELDGGKHYAELAVKMRDIDSAASSMYAEMARQELGHADNLHKLAVKMIDAERAAGHDAPAAMKAVWDWEHSLMIDKMARIKALLDMAR